MTVHRARRSCRRSQAASRSVAVPVLVVMMRCLARSSGCFEACPNFFEVGRTNAWRRPQLPIWRAMTSSVLRAASADGDVDAVAAHIETSASLTAIQWSARMTGYQCRRLGTSMLRAYGDTHRHARCGRAVNSPSSSSASVQCCGGGREDAFRRWRQSRVSCAAGAARNAPPAGSSISISGSSHIAFACRR